jgi:hypothetical protein
MSCCCRRTYDVGLVLDGSYSVLDMESEILVLLCYPVWIEACVAVVEKFMMLVMFFDGVFSLDE